MQFTGKSAIVVGGAGGIGSELCRSLLQHDVKNLAIVDILTSDESTTVKELSKDFDGKRIVYLQANIGKLVELELAFKEAVEKFGGKLDVVINTAGVFNDKNVNETLTVNAGGAINATILAVKHMHKETGGNGGVVVNISSVAGLDPLYLLPVYSASKEAIVAFTRAFSTNYYFKRTGVRIICVCPGGTLTSFLENFPKKMIYPDEDAAHRFFSDFPKQTVEDLGKHVINAAINAENGSVWTCDNNVMKPVVFQTYWRSGGI